MKKKHPPFRLLLGVTGCSQAEHTPAMLHKINFIRESFDVDLAVVATASSLKFFDVRQVKKLVGQNRFFSGHLDHTDEFEVPHIQLAQWAHMLLIYPASANTIARCSHGFTDELLANLVLATRAPVYFGPTMNEAMYQSQAVQENLKKLKKFKYHVLPREKTNVYVHAKKAYVEKDFVSMDLAVKAVLKEMKKHIMRSL